MRRLLKLSIVCGVGFLVAGCTGGGFGNDGRHVSDVERDHPITVTSSLVSEEIAVAPGARELGAPDAAKLSRLVGDFVRRGGGIFEIAVPVAGGDVAGAEARAQVVKDQVMKGGAHDREIKVRFSDIAGSGPVVVSYEAFMVTPPKCRPTEKNSTFNVRNTVQDTYGCVTQHNLAIMLSRPADRAKSAARSRFEATRRSRVVTDHRAGEQPSSSGGVSAGPARGF